ncbi:MAG: Fic family protein, partial [Rhodocyclaceae bacterium]|nr:Fic family protein [Rhodocyclaceae bacterium]
MGMTMANSYTDENGVYRNKLGATDAQQLRHLEYEITSRKSIDILDGNVLGLACSFDLAHLQAIHQYIFQDVYEWAGKIRTKPSSKRAPNGMVTVFAAPDEIVPDWQALARETNAFAAAAGLSFEQKRAALVDIFIEANRIHPF